MAAHLTEEEQIEAIKRWWKENGKFTVAIVLAVAVGWLGWNSWQDRQERLAQEASTQYAELMAAVEAAQGEVLTDEEAATAKVIAREIVESQADSLYGNMAGLLLAKLSAEAGELHDAATQLRQVAKNAANSGIARLADLRLARVLLAQGDYDGALASLSSNVGKGYQAAYSEARGDIYLAQNELDLAQSAYEEALASLAPEQSNRRSLLQLKLDNTRVSGNTSTTAGEGADSAVEGDA